jgi:5'-3' exonuclease
MFSPGMLFYFRYYYQGCASWNWYFPFHYAPFASDFKQIADMFKNFPTDTKPFNPMEQLMGVFPAGEIHSDLMHVNLLVSFVTRIIFSLLL